MKTIIIEGGDNTGKDTICNQIKLKADNLLYRHWQKPRGTNNQERKEYQRWSFKKEFDLRKTFIQDSYLNQSSLQVVNNDLILWNRSHIGEYVYGQLYRDDDPQWIYNLENIYNFSEENIFLVMLYADPEFLVENEDGHSFSFTYEEKKKEIELFHEGVDKSIIQNKIKIKVNDGKNYRPRTEIEREIFNTIFN